jgi:teichuronic acid biosynthesis glycosyltransferase TuaC
MGSSVAETAGYAPAAVTLVRPSTARRALRVLTFSSIFPNAAEPLHGLFVAARVQALARLAEVQVMAPVPAAPPFPGLAARYYRCADVPRVTSRNGVTVHHPRFAVIPRILKGTDPLLMAASCLPALRAMRRSFPFDVIDAHWACPDGVAAALLATALGVPYSITVRGDDINIFAQEKARRRAISWALRRAARVVALSNDLRDGVVELGTDPSRVSVIANGVDTARFHRIPRAEARLSLGIPADARLLLTVGRLHTSKGFPLLVEALARAGSAYADVRLVIVGDPDGESDATPAIRSAVERFSMQSRVSLIGRRTPAELTRWYSAADLFCLATTREGSANVLFEALACGLPCVTTDVGGNRETITDPGYGMLVAPDAAAFAAAIPAALERDWDRDRMVQRARSRGWDRVARECCDELWLATSAPPSPR